MNTYPGTMADDTLYFLAELFIQARNLRRARACLKRLVEKYPGSMRIPEVERRLASME